MMSTKSSALTDETSKSERLVRFSARLSFVRTSVSMNCVLMLPSLAQPMTPPAFSPHMPPALCWETTSPSKLQQLINPVASLTPAIPPPVSWARMLPLKLQFWMIPALSPAIPPRDWALPSGSIRPSAFRFRTTAPSPIYRNSPMADPADWSMIPLIVWPCPSKVPEKNGIGVNFFPA